MISFKMVQGLEFSSAPEVMNQAFLEIIQRKDRKPHCAGTQEKNLTKRDGGTPNNTEGKIGLSDGPCSSLGLVGRHGNERLYE